MNIQVGNSVACTITHHPSNHDDFGSDIFRHEEHVHESQIVHGQSQTVEHARPDKIRASRGVA